MAANSYITRELFGFLRELERNNNRQWFIANKDRYESVLKEPLLRFITDFGAHLRKISRKFLADPRPVGGSLFRIYRDVRFSPDKRPYKTHAGIHFGHVMSKGVHAPGFYLHLAPGEVFGASGLWHPDSETLAKVRDAIAKQPKRWKGAVSGRTFKQRCTFEGDSLVRPPKGYDPNHPLIDDIKRKDFIAVTNFSEKDALASGFVGQFEDHCRATAPLMQFLTTALGLPW